MIDGINHVTLACSDLARSIEFYANVLGCKLMPTWDNDAYLTAGSLWLCLAIDKHLTDEISPTYSHVAFNIRTQDFSAMQIKIQNASIPQWKENKSEGNSLYILDPDQHKLEIHCSTLQARLAYMQKHPYKNMVIYTQRTSKYERCHPEFISGSRFFSKIDPEKSSG